MALYGISRLNNLKEAIKSMPVENMLADITEENKDFIADKNIANLEQGVDSKGEEIVPEYSPFTKAYKQSVGQPFDRVTLKDTGAFHQSITPEVTPNGFGMIAEDMKWGKLTEKYGQDIVGISRNDIASLREEVYLPNLFFKVRDYIKQLNG